MTTLREAAEIALEALEYYRSGEDYQPTPASDAITALREALAEPEQEPLCTAAMFDDAFLAKSGLSPDTKLYTHPPQRKPLTNEELDALAIDEDGLPNSHFEFARAIERAHGIGEKK